MKRNHSRIMVCAVAVIALLGTACNESPPPGQTVAVKIARSNDAAQLARGRALFMQNCAVCHGERAEGDVQWRYRASDGTFPPPPLNGSGHAWHHPRAWLQETIMRGTEPVGHMPGWQDKLSAQQVDDIIAWFQSLWPEEVYAAWAEMELRAQGASARP